MSHVGLIYTHTTEVNRQVLAGELRTDLRSEQRSSEMRPKTLLLLLLGSLLAALEARSAAGSHHGRSMPGSPFNISTNDRGLEQVVLNATCSFNKQTNDAFLFRPSAIHRAQRQIVKGIRYIVDLEISRTVCRKREHNNNNLTDCDFQPEGHLHQTFQCHFEVWVVPWKHEMNNLVFLCKP